MPKVYLKDESFDPIYRSKSFSFMLRSKLMSFGLLTFGFLILGTQVILPLITFKTQNKISKPMESSVLGVATGFTPFKFEELDSTEVIQTEQNFPKFFTIDVPKLGIKDALVETNSHDLSPENNLGHYNGSSLPGEKGNTFIYGHSVLPWFFNPKNYKTIFSTLGDLEPGDTFVVNYNDKKLTYKVESKEILKPEEVDPLGIWKPAYLNTSTAELMTCWPAGTKNKRLLVRAVLID